VLIYLITGPAAQSAAIVYLFCSVISIYGQIIMAFCRLKTNEIRNQLFITHAHWRTTHTHYTHTYKQARHRHFAPFSFTFHRVILRFVTVLCAPRDQAHFLLTVYGSLQPLASPFRVFRFSGLGSIRFVFVFVRTENYYFLLCVRVLSLQRAVCVRVTSAALPPGGSAPNRLAELVFSVFLEAIDGYISIDPHRSEL